jgi:hypothetical protein
VDFPPYVDIRCFPPEPRALDDTCRLKEAAKMAEGRILWIPSSETLLISPDEEAAHCPDPIEYIFCHVNCDPAKDPILHGIPIPSNTIVTGEAP